MPLNVEMEKIIKNNAHLIEDEEMPKSFKELLAHVQGWKIVCKKWDDKDFSENSSCVAFPQDLHPYVANTYAKLKRRQSKLSSSLF
jgi:hypothetical protein